MIAANPEALAFLSRRRSRPAKLFTTPVPDRAALRDILTVALRVPDHGKLTPWRLIVLEKAGDGAPCGPGRSAGGRTGRRCPEDRQGARAI